jgi:hypothetical protein
VILKLRLFLRIHGVMGGDIASILSLFPINFSE